MRVRIPSIIIRRYVNVVKGNSRLRDTVKGLIIPVLRFLVIPRNDGTSNVLA